VTSDLCAQLEAALGAAYAIERELSGGGMSRVFLATEVALGRRVVVKVLAPELAAEVSLERFKREIMLAARLQHPHVVPVLSAGEVTKLPFFTMPYIEGESLRTRIARTGELPVAEAVRILREVASALEHAHDRGIAHRDIKPDNVLLCRGSSMVTDFGVAKALDASAVHHSDGTITSRGIALGTPAYMAPEQAAADPAMDQRVDLYAFGALAYELLTGQAPFAGRSPQAMLAAHVAEAPESITRRRPGLPPVLASLVMRCLEKRAADRPQTASDVVQLLDSINTPSGGTTPAATTPWRGMRLPRLTAFIVAGLLLGALGIVVGRELVRSRVAAADAGANRVFVSRFANNTGIPSVDQVGPMAADWITRGLAETGLFEVVQDSAGRAGTVVRGAIYRRGDSLQLLAQITDARSGRVLRSLGPIGAAAADPLSGVELLRGRIVGSLATLVDPGFGGLAVLTSQPPSFEAYRELVDARDALNRYDHTTAVAHYLRAAAMDSSYLYPVVAAVESYFRLGQCDVVDSLGAVLRDRRDRLTPYEAYSVDEVSAQCRGAWDAAYRAAKRKEELAPRSELARYGVAVAALAVGRPAETVALLDAVDMERAPRSALRSRFDFYLTYARSLHLVGSYRRELQIARRMRRLFPDLDDALAVEMRALVSLDRVDELRPLLDRAIMMSSVPTLEWTAEELRVHGHTAEGRAVASELADWIRARPTQEAQTVVMRSALARALYAADRWDQARALVDTLVERYPESVGLLGLRGRIAARLGDSATAQAASNALLAAAHSSRETNALTRAKIAALLGQREIAMRLLRDAVAQGEMQALRMREEPDLLGLRDYPPFETLVRPVG
jgi:tRNA A-37 threonylcarbamoyl transferase component Bud32/tetratricopeptide (TPR) repeat protein